MEKYLVNHNHFVRPSLEQSGNITLLLDGQRSLVMFLQAFIQELNHQNHELQLLNDMSKVNAIKSRLIKI